MCKIKDEMCIGCDTTEDVTKCDNTMCEKCWFDETRDESYEK